MSESVRVMKPNNGNRTDTFQPQKLQNVKILTSEQKLEMMGNAAKQISQHLESKKGQRDEQEKINKDQYVVANTVQIFGSVYGLFRGETRWLKLPDKEIWNHSERLLNEFWRHHAAGDIISAARTLHMLTEEYAAASREFIAYMDGIEGGGDAAITSLKGLVVAGQLAAACVTGGITGIAVGAAYVTVQEIAAQSSELIAGLRQSLDFKTAFVNGGKAFIMTLVGGIVSGKLINIASRSFGSKILFRMSKDQIAALAERLEMSAEQVKLNPAVALNKVQELIVDFFASNVAIAPLNTAIEVTLNELIDNNSSGPMSVETFIDRVMENAFSKEAIGQFFLSHIFSVVASKYVGRVRINEPSGANATSRIKPIPKNTFSETHVESSPVNKTPPPQVRQKRYTENQDMPNRATKEAPPKKPNMTESLERVRHEANDGTPPHSLQEQHNELHNKESTSFSKPDAIDLPEDKAVWTEPQSIQEQLSDLQSEEGSPYSRPDAIELHEDTATWTKPQPIQKQLNDLQNKEGSSFTRSDAIDLPEDMATWTKPQPIQEQLSDLPRDFLFPSEKFIDISNILTDKKYSRRGTRKRGEPFRNVSREEQLYGIPNRDFYDAESYNDRRIKTRRWAANDKRIKTKRRVLKKGDICPAFGNRIEAIQQDHIIPKNTIQKLPGFAMLKSEKAKYEIENMRVNLEPVNQRLNSSRSDLSYEEWAKTETGRTANPKFLANQIAKEKKILELIQKRIDFHLRRQMEKELIKGHNPN